MVLIAQVQESLIDFDNIAILCFVFLWKKNRQEAKLTSA